MNLRVVGASLVVSIKSFYREKTTMFFTTTFPILLILVFGTIFMDADKVNFDLYIQDLDGTKASAEIVKTLDLTGKFKITKVDPAIDATQYAKNNKVNLVLIIPKDLENSYMQYLQFGGPDAFVTITYVYDPSSNSVDTKMQILNMVFAKMNQKLTGKPPFVRTAEISILTRKYRFIEFFIPGIIAMAVMTASLFGTVNVNTELQQKGITRKLATTPISRTDWVLSNILYQIILAVISTTAMLLVSYAVFDVKFRINAWLPLFVVLDVFTFVGIGMVLTRIVKDAQSAAAAANAIAFPMMFLSGSFFPLEMTPRFLQAFAKMLPLYYVNEGLRASMVFNDNETALSYSAIMGAFAAVVFILGITATRWEEGK
ncbi:MAG: ABC transporter permease [Deltaproteobacteria bacterium]|nr:ABC transporter permease [Deltaproteobacteria bacterium]